MGPGKYAPYDEDRRVAEWVFTLGGVIQFDRTDDTRTLLETATSPHDLPKAPFAIHTIALINNRPEITDILLVRLQSLKNLRELKLTGTSVTAKGIAELKKALPKCKIVWDGGAKPKTTKPPTANKAKAKNR